jgi:hypothetical protein
MVELPGLAGSLPFLHGWATLLLQLKAQMRSVQLLQHPSRTAARTNASQTIEEIHILTASSANFRLVQMLQLFRYCGFCMGGLVLMTLLVSGQETRRSNLPKH